MLKFYKLSRIMLKFYKQFTLKFHKQFMLKFSKPPFTKPLETIKFDVLRNSRRKFLKKKFVDLFTATATAENERTLLPNLA